MNKIKMIVTDMDGTLLNSKKEMHPETLSIIDKLIKSNIKFVVASGRQYFNLYNRFNDDRIIYVAENGSFIFKNNEIFSFSALNKNIVKEILKIVDNINNTHVIISGKKSSYTKSIDEFIEKHFREYYSKIEIISNFEDIDDEICKIAIFNLDGTEKNVYPHLSKYSKDYSVTVSSFEWLDVFDLNINKGEAINLLKEEFNLKNDEIMIFGDYLNDLEMYSVSSETYAMENAHPQIKEVAKYIAPSNDEFGVISVIKEKFNI